MDIGKIDRFIDKKKCTSCKIEKLYREFTTNKANKDGFAYCCNTCYNEKKKERLRLRQLYKQYPELKPLPNTKRVCMRCKDIKDIEEFTTCKRTKSGYRTLCKQCAAEDNMKRKYSNDPALLHNRMKSARWRRENPELAKLKAQVGSMRYRGIDINEEQYTSLISGSNGNCEICCNPNYSRHPDSDKPKALFIDHDHVTGKVRGLICHHCNVALGGAKDNIETLYKLI